MEFKFSELTDKNKKYFKIKNNKECLKELKVVSEFDAVCVDFDFLNLGQALYGNSKKESVEIQKKNVKNVMAAFKWLKKAIAVLKKKNNFDGVIYVECLSEKKNNNDIMIAGMLDIRYNVGIFHKMTRAVEVACDFLDQENSLNKMCDFKNNKCTKHREVGKDCELGCCPAFCKYRTKGPCPHKNLSCKIFMCDYLINKGKFFTPFTIPVLIKHMSLLERFMCLGNLCKPLKKSMRYLWLVRILLSVGIAIIGALLILMLVSKIKYSV